MIGILTPQGRLDLREGTKIDFVLVNPLYSGEIGYASQSFNFSIPATDPNRVALGLKDITGIEDFDELIDVVLEIGGMPWEDATLEVRVVPNEGEWNAALYVGEARLSLRLAAKKLKEYSLGGIRTISTEPEAPEIADDVLAHANASVLADHTTFDYVFFPIRNTYTFYGGKHPGEDHANIESNYVNYWREGQFWAELFTNTAPAPTFQAVHNLVPQPYVVNLIKMILVEEGYSLGETAWSLDPEILSLTLYNNFAIDKRTYFFFFNTWVEVNFYAPTIDLKNHVPDITASELVIGQMRSFGLVPSFNETELNLLTRNEILAITEERDWRDYVISYQWDRGQVNGQIFESALDSNDELTGGDYLRGEGSFEVAGEVNTYGDLPNVATIQPADIYYVKEDNGYYELVLVDPINGLREWIRYAGRYDRIIVGEESGAEENQTPMSTSQIYKGENVNGDWRIPWIQALGSSIEFGLGLNPYSYRTHFYRGMVTDDATDGAYPQAGSDDNLGAYNYSLYWHGDNGLYEKWWKVWAEYRQNARPGTFRLTLPFMELFRLDPFKRVKVRTKDGEVSGYWKELRLTIDSVGISDVFMDLEARME